MERIRENAEVESTVANNTAFGAANTMISNHQNDQTFQSNANIADLNVAYLNKQGLDGAKINKIPPQKKDDPSQYIIPEGFKRRQQQPQIDEKELAMARTKIINNSKVTPFGPRPVKQETSPPPNQESIKSQPQVVTAKA